jgi:hypothetical protein
MLPSLLDQILGAQRQQSRDRAREHRDINADRDRRTAAAAERRPRQSTAEYLAAAKLELEKLPDDTDIKASELVALLLPQARSDSSVYIDRMMDKRWIYREGGGVTDAIELGRKIERAEREIERLRNDKADLADILRRHGFVPCDSPICNCGSWHHRYGYPERMEELKVALEEAGHPLCNANGNKTLNALKQLIAERDELRRLVRTP